MSHFCTMVIGDDVENQLSPFEEKEVDRYVKYTKEELIENQRNKINEYKNNFYDEYLKDPVTYENKCLGNHSHLKYLKEEFPKKLLFTDEELYKEAIKYEEMENIGDNGELYSTYNPNSKWDWYQVGGRWMGQLKVLKKSQHIIGERSLLDNTIEKKQRGKYRYVEGAKIKDVLWEQMNHQDFKSIKHNARFWEINVEGSPLKDGEDPKDYLNFYKKEYYKDLYGTKENYIMKQGLFYTYAMLIYDEDNGIDEWIEQGRMGFFGLGTENKNELESYLDTFYKIIHDPKYQDYYITIVDCHI